MGDIITIKVLTTTSAKKIEKGVNFELEYEYKRVASVPSSGT